MDKLKEILDEIHLYKNKSELLVKDIIWAISWIGGIYAIKNSTDKQAMSSAYLIFALSLLMEFGGKIKSKNKIISRIIDGLFCTASICVLLMSMISLLGGQLLANHFSVMYNISKGIMLFIFADFIVSWIEPEVTNADILGIEDATKEEQISIFNKTLLNGGLGDISKGDKNE